MAQINHEQVSKFAEHLKGLPPEALPSPLTFAENDREYPSVGDPAAISFFTLTCLQQFRFWYGDEQGYVSRMQVPLDGKLRSGSYVIWRLFRRKLDQDPEFFRPERWAEITPEEFWQTLSLPGGMQWPDFEARFALTRELGRWFLANHQTPESLVAKANACGEGQCTGRLGIFLYELSKGPYGSDKFQKKSLLLAMALANRPEHFLRVEPHDKEWKPIIDYHLMRVCLRLGMIELDYYTGQEQANKARVWVSAQQEGIIRAATHQVVAQLIAESGLSMATIDSLLWLSGRYCPDYKKPDCDACMFQSVCPKQVELFQPTFRTTAY